MERDQAERLMGQAADLARPMRPHPNPRVGAIVLDANGAEVARAAHRGPGHAHAEAEALERAGDRAAGGTLVVTLEPCHHQGRTPPCTAATIASGVTTVWYGADDPDPRVRGRGVAALRDAGITVEQVAGRDMEQLDPAYFHHRRTGRARLHWKFAMTLDGQVAADDRSSRWVSGQAARRQVHEMRAATDAVMVGAGTLRADDPRLTVRLEDHDGPQPISIVVAGREPIDPGSRVFANKVIVYSPTPIDLPAEVVVMPGPHGVDLEAMTIDLARRDLLDVLVEGGPSLARGLLAGRLISSGTAFVAAKLALGSGLSPVAGPFATMGDAWPAAVTGVAMAGTDVRIDFAVEGD